MITWNIRFIIIADTTYKYMKNYDWQHQGATTAQIVWGCFKLQISFVMEWLFVGVMQQLTHLGTFIANNSMPECHFWPISSCVTPRIRCNHSTICLIMLKSPTIISQGRFICRSDAATITHFVLTDRCIYYWMMADGCLLLFLCCCMMIDWIQ